MMERGRLARIHEVTAKPVFLRAGRPRSIATRILTQFQFLSLYFAKLNNRVASVCGECWGNLIPEEQMQTHQSHQSVMTSTTFEIVGHKIIRNLGVVRGITVRSRSIFGTIGGSLQTLVGGNITLFTELCEKTRGEAFDMMVQHALERGANAVVGVRYDATDVLQGVTEVLCYGTAVMVDAASDNRD
jgi:uncharacterized protein YbjQ (UPF0145 family)